MSCNQKKLVSIIVPLYNNEKYLCECINSLLNQTYKNIEIILVDDGSKDRCLEICKDFQKKDNRIRVFSQDNSGVSAARNLGLKNVRGDFICFVDSDDRINNNYVETHLQNMKKYNADISVLGINKKFDQINDTNGKIVTFDKNDFQMKLFYDINMSAGVINKFYNKKIISNQQFENYMIGEDLVFNFNLSKNTDRVVFDSRKLYNYRIENVNSAIHGSFKPRSFEIINILEIIAKKNLHNKSLYNIIKSRYPLEGAKLLIKMISSRYYNENEYRKCFELIKINFSYMVTCSKISFKKKIFVSMIWVFKFVLCKKNVEKSKLLYNIFNKLKGVIG